MSDDVRASLEAGVERLMHLGVRRVHVLAWRDLDDTEAGGSEVHADELMKRWAALGLEVTHRTSTAAGLPPRVQRNGYTVDRAGNRYTVFGRTVFDELTGRLGASDALVEVWNGVPWFSPVWYRRPHVTVLHHVHGPMWDQIFPGPLAAAGRTLETRIAPRLYRSGMTVTPSEATREELIEIGFRPDRVVAVRNGVDPRFVPGGTKTEHPSLIAVGRLAPVKRFDELIRAVRRSRETHPQLTLTIVGDGPQFDALQSQIASIDAQDWVKLPGRIDHDNLVEEYQRAWLTVSASLAEGWGLSLTEGAACGTPGVATDIRGHRSSVIDGVTGVLCDLDELGSTIARVIDDPELRDRLRSGALEWAGELSWDRSAAGVTNVLADEAERRQSQTNRRGAR